MEHHHRLRLVGDALAEAEEIDGAFDRIGDAVQQIGFAQLVYASARTARLPSGEWVPPPQLFWNFPKGWDEGIDRYIVSDPYFHACFEGRLAVDWGEIQNRPDLNHQERDFIENARHLKLTCGLTVPIHMAGGKFAYMSFIADCGERSWSALMDEIQPALFFLAHRFNHLVNTKFGGLHPHGKHDFHPGGRDDLLTDRERECLFWSAQGKTAEDIGAILDLSPETIKIYLKRINVKLNAINRCHAVAKALQSGIIDLSDGPPSHRHA